MALQAPHVNTGTMTPFLGMLATELDEGDRAIIVMDRAGWHASKTLEVPACITVLLLTPYSPELNPIARLFGYLRGHCLSNRAYDVYQHPLDASAQAWHDLAPALLRSVCACEYLAITAEEGR